MKCPGCLGEDLSLHYCPHWLLLLSNDCTTGCSLELLVYGWFTMGAGILLPFASMKRGSYFSRTGRAQLALRPWRKWPLSRRTGASVCVSLRSFPLSPSVSSLPVSLCDASILCGSPMGPAGRKPSGTVPSAGDNMCSWQAKSKDTAHPRHLLGAAQDASLAKLLGCGAIVVGTACVGLEGLTSY